MFKVAYLHKLLHGIGVRSVAKESFLGDLSVLLKDQSELEKVIQDVLVVVHDELGRSGTQNRIQFVQGHQVRMHGLGHFERGQPVLQRRVWNQLMHRARVQPDNDPGVVLGVRVGGVLVLVAVGFEGDDDRAEMIVGAVKVVMFVAQKVRSVTSGGFVHFKFHLKQKTIARCQNGGYFRCSP